MCVRAEEPFDRIDSSRPIRSKFKHLRNDRDLQNSQDIRTSNFEVKLQKAFSPKMFGPKLPVVTELAFKMIRNNAAIEANKY